MRRYVGMGSSEVDAFDEDLMILEFFFIGSSVIGVGGVVMNAVDISVDADAVQVEVAVPFIVSF